MLVSIKKQAGFTLVELILAMAIFSFGLLVIVSGFLALIGFYQNGIQSRAVQLSARNAINQIAINGRGSGWFTYNPNIICMSTGTMFYLETVGPNADRLMQNTGWHQDQPCIKNTILAAAVTNSDVKVSAFIIEPTDSYDVAGNPTPCPAAGLCDPGNTNGLASHRSLRVTIRVTSDIADLDPTTTPPNISCKPSAPAVCVITALSTTLTAGSIQ